MNQYRAKKPTRGQRTAEGWATFRALVRKLRQSEGSQAVHRERRAKEKANG